MSEPISYRKVKIRIGEICTIELPLRTVIYALADLMSNVQEESWTEPRIMANGDGLEIRLRVTRILRETKF